MTPELPFALTLGAITFLLTVIWGSPFVEILRRLRAGKQIRESGPATHQTKTGTPTMGGILILVPVVLITLGLNLARVIQSGVTGSSILLPLALLVAFGVLGSIDDIEGIRSVRERGEGIRARTKFAGQIIFSIIAALVMAYVDGGFQNANGVYVPLFPSFIELPPVLWIVIAVVAIGGFVLAQGFLRGDDVPELGLCDVAQCRRLAALQAPAPVPSPGDGAERARVELRFVDRIEIGWRHDARPAVAVLHLERNDDADGGRGGHAAASSGFWASISRTTVPRPLVRRSTARSAAAADRSALETQPAPSHRRGLCVGGWTRHPPSRRYSAAKQKQREAAT